MSSPDSTLVLSLQPLRVWLKAGEEREDFFGIKCTNIDSCSNNVGMKNETEGSHEINPADAQFLERLRQHPELRARFQSILELSDNADGPLRTADEMEERLIQDLRQLGHTTMNHWATQAEQRVGAELKGADATVRSRKKKR